MGGEGAEEGAGILTICRGFLRDGSLKKEHNTNDYIFKNLTMASTVDNRKNSVRRGKDWISHSYISITEHPLNFMQG